MRFLYLFILICLAPAVWAQSAGWESLSPTPPAAQLQTADIAPQVSHACYKPSEPFCVRYVEKEGKYDDCLDDLQEYVVKMGEYGACVNKAVNKEVAEEVSKTMGKFACKIKGDDGQWFCN